MTVLFACTIHSDNGHGVVLTISRTYSSGMRDTSAYQGCGEGKDQKTGGVLMRACCWEGKGLGRSGDRDDVTLERKPGSLAKIRSVLGCMKFRDEWGKTSR